ncbi:MAG: FkbM family methyltransferase [Bacteroidetes bacterium]|nr:FkbM family methyltransferase [Bacteroidota bacterium]
MKAKIKSIIKRFILTMQGRMSHLKIGIKCNYKWYGNTYGGFYVFPNILNNKSIVYSFGIGEDMSFDNAMIKNHNCQIFCFDPTPKSINWFKSQEKNENIHFYEYGISNTNEFMDFYLPLNSDHVSGSVVSQKNVDVNKKVIVEMKSLKTIMQELGHTHIDVLKIDIEGSEYDVIDNILNEELSVTQILIEFHDRFFTNGTLKTKATIEKLRDSGYEIFAISNSLEEISFIKKNAL